MVKNFKYVFALACAALTAFAGQAQVNAVTFGKNRVQYKKLHWSYYQTDNFNVYYYEGGQELAKFVLQVAEAELPQLEKAAEYSLQRRANIILYNDYKDLRSSNIGLESITFNTGGYTTLVNNKMPIYYDANHANLRRQVREGISDVLVKNILFGDELKEMAGNQTLDMPQWLVNGYTAYLGENWSTLLDDDLKSEILSGNFSKFKSFSFERPQLAGHAFWYFIEEKYKKENVTYLFYLMRTYKNLDKATIQVTKKKFKDLAAEFMEYEEDKYSKDIRKRRAYPKGSAVESFYVKKDLDYFRFNVNPNKKNNSYVMARYKKGITSVIYNDGYTDKTILKYGVRTFQNEIDPHYPMMAWDPRGTRFGVIYVKEGRIRFMVYDVERSSRVNQEDFTDRFDQIQDFSFMENSNHLLLSAVKNGHSDIYTLNVNNDKLVQVTNDVYDDLDPSFVTFPNKTGILFSSNRPDAASKGGDTSLPSENRFNIFMATDFGSKAEFNQVTQLTAMNHGNARLPMQYNLNHFTFVSDANGIANRYAGFFRAEAIGYDTLVVIGEDILRNPSQGLIDSTLRANNKTETDSIAVVAMTSDSSYVFPITNYPSNLAETRIAGDNDQVSEVTRQSDDKTLYKLKIDQNVLQKRNVSAVPTEYGKKIMRESELTQVKTAQVNDPVVPVDTSGNVFQSEFPKDTTQDANVFQSEFAPDSARAAEAPVVAGSETEKPTAEPLRKAKLFVYKPGKWSADFGSAGVNGTPIFNRYQIYTGGTGPINLSSSTPLQAMIQIGASELMEDYRFLGAFKIGTNLKDNEWFVSFQNLRRRLDWGLTYYRNAFGLSYEDNNGIKPAREYSNLYQFNVAYPFDEANSLRFTGGVRSDRIALSSVDQLSARYDDINPVYALSKLEFVHDNTLNLTTNILNGFRYKVYGEWNREVSKGQTMYKPNMFNVGLDARYYYPIYRNFIWAGRAAADFSMGNQKVVYYLGGVDGWLMFGNNTVTKNGVTKDRYFNTNNPPAQNGDYAFQSLAVNMRGYTQNLASGNNAVVFNSEFRLPILSTFFDKISANAFLNNFMITQFIDLGTAWDGKYNGIKRPTTTLANNQGTVVVKLPAGGIGPFAGGYGFGARTNLLGYYVRFDAAWKINGLFKGSPKYYVALGLDF